MLVIRMQRTGRSGHAQFRVVVQDSRTAPSSGRVVAQVGSYNPHTKVAILDSEKISTYMKNGARPSDRAARLFKSNKIKLPDWFSPAPTKKSVIKKTDKLRRNRPAGAPAPEPKAEEPAAEEATTEATAESVTAEEPATEPAKEEPSEQAEQPAETAVEEVAEPATEPEAEVTSEEPATEAVADAPEAEEKPAEA